MDNKQIAHELARKDGHIDHFMDAVEPEAYGLGSTKAAALIEQLLKDFALFVKDC